MFKKPFSFEGRIRRLEYGLSNLIFLVPYFLIAPYMQLGELTEQLVALIIYIPLGWFILAQGTKRCHDKGVNGWWQLLPFYGLIILFYRGDIGPNDYGEDPKGSGYDFRK
jgi:uncharacterized membrane protein YhaH (DUF805 family)